MYLLFVVHGPVTNSVIDKKRNFDSKQGCSHFVVVSGTKIDHDMLVPA